MEAMELSVRALSGELCLFGTGIGVYIKYVVQECAKELQKHVLLTNCYKLMEPKGSWKAAMRHDCRGSVFPVLLSNGTAAFCFPFSFIN